MRPSINLNFFLLVVIWVGWLVGDGRPAFGRKEVRRPLFCSIAIIAFHTLASKGRGPHSPLKTETMSTSARRRLLHDFKR
jgi:hypothetical protein